MRESERETIERSLRHAHLIFPLIRLLYTCQSPLSLPLSCAYQPPRTPACTTQHRPNDIVHLLVEKSNALQTRQAYSLHWRRSVVHAAQLFSLFSLPHSAISPTNSFDRMNHERLIDRSSIASITVY